MRLSEDARIKVTAGILNKLLTTNGTCMLVAYQRRRRNRYQRCGTREDNRSGGVGSDVRVDRLLGLPSLIANSGGPFSCTHDGVYSGTKNGPEDNREARQRRRASCLCSFAHREVFVRKQGYVRRKDPFVKVKCDCKLTARLD